MELVSTPEPHYIPGYTGYSPQYLYRVGKTYGNLTHKLLIDPCVRHSPKLLVEGPNETQIAEDRPTPKEIDLIKTHEQEGDAVFQFPIVPGYDGFIPNIRSKIGDRFLAAATAGVAEHEEYMQKLKCERRNLQHRDTLQSGQGLFERNLGERSMLDTTYQLPLIPVRPEGEGILRDQATVIKDSVPYSKDTPPHFMKQDDPEKYIISGYGGHVPMAFNRLGESNKELTTSALCEFANNYHHRRSAEAAPIETAGVGTSLPTISPFKIYHRTTGMIPNYAGHVPGEMFKFGGTFGRNTINAKRWLEENL